MWSGLSAEQVHILVHLVLRTSKTLSANGVVLSHPHTRTTHESHPNERINYPTLAPRARTSSKKINSFPKVQSGKFTDTSIQRSVTGQSSIKYLISTEVRKEDTRQMPKVPHRHGKRKRGNLYFQRWVMLAKRSKIHLKDQILTSTRRKMYCKTKRELLLLKYLKHG